ncbi:MAG: hypothetical protein FJX75_20770 [Armatimonadetes bacterium]|nr:hypothetical protein [Armatimonadota bacterium]
MKTAYLAPGVLLLLLCVVAGLGLVGCGGDRAPVGALGDAVSADAGPDTAADEAAAPTFGRNLVKNGGFEMDTGGDGSADVAPSKWTRPEGKATVVLYGAPGGFPTASSPGPPSRGNNFVAGGNGSALSRLYQRVNVSWAAATIDAGDAQCIVAAFVGGYGSQGDSVAIYVKFRDASGVEIDGGLVPNVTPADRGNKTGLLRRTWKGKLPAGTRFIDLNPKFERVSGQYNDAYLDAVSLKLNDVTP